jgi:hypothetical protein
MQKGKNLSPMYVGVCFTWFPHHHTFSSWTVKPPPSCFSFFSAPSPSQVPDTSPSAALGLTGRKTSSDPAADGEGPGPKAGSIAPLALYRRSSTGAPGAGSEFPPVTLSSERELAHELEAMSQLLKSLAADWQQRIASMARLGSIAKGSPQLHEALAEALKPLREHLTVQVGGGRRGRGL